jgi:hypothetical protein
MFLLGSAVGEVVINEVHYDPDPKTEFIEFIEVSNSGPASVELTGWQFADGVDFSFPDGTALGAGEFLLIAENSVALEARFPSIPAGTALFQFDGSLSNDGERLSLVNGIGVIIDVVTYRAEFPWPIAPNGEGDSMQLINPNLDNDLGGAWRAGLPTPGVANTVFAANAPPIIRQVEHSPQAPDSSEATTISAKVTDSDEVASVMLLFQVVAPGDFVPARFPNSYGMLTSNPNAARQPNPAFENPTNWISIAMVADALDPTIYRAVIPVQDHRTLIRYRIVAEDDQSESIRVPYADDPSLNFAYFVYDGIPDYTAGTTTYDAEMLTGLPVYTMITRDADRKFAYAYSTTGDGNLQIPKGNAARSTYNWECALVYDGVVYDHVDWRLRQNNDRYSGNGKRSMRYRMNRGHYFQARDEKGEKLPVKWRRFNTSKMSRFGGGNSYGFHETINSKLWRMIGVECPYFLPAHFRMIDGADEAPDQYNGDFFGFATIVQDIDGRLLDERKLPNGNMYKLKDGVANPLDLQRNQSRTAVTDGSDFRNIRNNLDSSQSDSWLRDHVDWDQWKRYHAVVEAVRHYDFGTPTSHFKNRAWYFKEESGAPFGLLRIVPHDHDASWAKGYHDSLNSVGNSIGTGFPWAAIFDDIKRPPTGTGKIAFTTDYRNFIREFRQLLWQEETVKTLIDDQVALLARFSQADRARWTGAPAAAGRESMVPPGNIASPMRNFAFRSDTMYGSNLAGGRGAFLDQIAADSAIPNQATITYSGEDGFPVGGLQFTSSAFSNPQGSGTFDKMEWRLAEVAGLEGDGDRTSFAASGDLWKYFDAGTDPGINWTGADYDDGSWDEGESQIGYGETDQITTVAGRHTATYFRRTIEIPDPENFSSFTAGLIRDDGAIVFLNGTEVWRNQMPEGPVDFTTIADASASGSNERDFQIFDIPAGLFVAGENIIAVEIHQRPVQSSDMSFDFQLEGTPVTPERIFEWERAWESGELDAYASTINPPALATRSGKLYRARVRHADSSGRWGEWSEALEFTASPPDVSAYRDSLIVGEIMYHPADPTPTEIAAGFNDDELFEFIEIRNAGTQPLDLTDVRFTKGIDFDFSGTLAPGAYLLVVNNLAAFEMRYGPGLPVTGEWSGKLDNGGERLKLSFGAGETISDFIFDDIAPWPISPDGDGTSLTRIGSDPSNDPRNWRASISAGGSPGESDASIFTGDANADSDGDTLSALMEYASGTSDTTPDLPGDLFMPRAAGEGTFVINHRRNLTAGDIHWIIERSENLVTWNSAEDDLEFLSTTDHEEGTATLRFAIPRGSGLRRFFWRARVALITP